MSQIWPKQVHIITTRPIMVNAKRHQPQNNKYHTHYLYLFQLALDTGKTVITDAFSDLLCFHIIYEIRFKHAFNAFSVNSPFSNFVLIFFVLSNILR